MSKIYELCAQTVMSWLDGAFAAGELDQHSQTRIDNRTEAISFVSDGYDALVYTQLNF